MRSATEDKRTKRLLQLCKETLSSGEHSDALTEKQNMVTRGSSAPTPRTNERSAFCSSACKEMLSPADTRTP